MEIVLWIAAAITVAGSLMKMLIPVLLKSEQTTKEARYIELGPQETGSEETAINQSTTSSNAKKVLWGFTCLVFVFGVITLIRYWDFIRINQDSFYFVVWLFIFMVAGMFVQVIASNYRDGKRLFGVTASQLIFPVLFSIVVFYPIWAIASSATHSFFSIHAAFLNGYFWESVVAAATPPKVPT